jgi:hypothetical protein
MISTVYVDGGANVMIGVNHSFSSLLRIEVPDLIVVKCVCHSLHLTAEHLCKITF